MPQLVDEACNTAAEKNHHVLKLQAVLADRVLDEHSRWPDVQELPKSRWGVRPSIQLFLGPAQATSNLIRVAGGSARDALAARR